MKNLVKLLCVILTTMITISCQKETLSITPSKNQLNTDRIIYTDNLKMPDKIASISNIIVDSTKISFTVISGSSPIKAGDILLSSKGAGYLRKVVSSIINGNKIILNTENASMEEAIQKSHFDSTFFLQPTKGMINDALNYKEPIDINGTKGLVTITSDKPVFTPASATGEWSMVFPNFKYEITDNNKYKFELSTDAFNLSISSDLSIQSDFTIADGFNYLSIRNSKSISVEFINAKISLAGGKIGNDTKSFKLIPDISFGVFPILGVPFIPSLDVEFGIEYELTAAGEFKSTSPIKVTCSDASTLIFQKGQIPKCSWSPITTMNGNLSFKATPGFAGELKGFIKPSLNLKAVGQVGPYFFAKGFEYNKVTFPPMECELGWGLSGGIGAKLEIFSKKIISSELTLAEKRWPFMKGSLSNNPPNSPIIIEPVNSAINVSLNPQLSWNCTDPDGDDLTYNVLFGESNPPTIKIASGIVPQNYQNSGLTNSKKYYWSVEATDKYGSKTAGSVWSFTTITINNPPIVPTNPSPSTGATNQPLTVTLSWSCTDPEVDNLTYDVYFGTTSNPTTLVSPNQTAQNLSRTGLLDNTKYYWKVVAKDGINTPVTGDAWNFTTSLNNSPNKPSNPSPSPASINQPLSVTLIWNCTDPDGDNLTYDVYFGTNTNPTILVSPNQTSQSLTRTGLIKNTPYYWKVVAKDGISNPTTGDTWSFTTIQVNVSPNAPINSTPLTGSTGQPVSITLNWNCTDPDGDNLTYDVYFGTDSNPTTLVSPNQSSQSLNRTGLLFNTTYYWKVVAKDGINTPTTGEIWSFTTNTNSSPDKPNTPSPFNGASNQPLSLTLNWNCTDPDGDNLTYDVYFGTNSNPTTLVSPGQSSQSLSRTGLSYNTTYYWKVVAKDGISSPATGYIWSFTTNPNTSPNKPKSASPSNGSTNQLVALTLSWDCTDPDGDNLTYDVYFGTNSNPSTLVSPNQTSQSLIRIGLLNSTTYYWKVVAKDGISNPTTGDIWSFKTVDVVNRAPEEPWSPNPGDGSTGQPKSINMGWTSKDPDGDALSYELKIGTDANTTIGYSAAPYNFTPPGLAYETKYYWRIITSDSKSQTTGPVWSFTTGTSANTAPSISNTPTPAIGSTGIATSLTFSWTTNDVNGDPISNTVLLGKTNPPQTIAFPGAYNISSFYTTGLSPNTQYFWQVKSTDGKLVTTYGPIWYFTTGSK